MGSERRHVRRRLQQRHFNTHGGREDEGQRHRRIRPREEELKAHTQKDIQGRWEGFVQRTAALGHEEKEKRASTHTWSRHLKKSLYFSVLCHRRIISTGNRRMPYHHHCNNRKEGMRRVERDEWQ